MRFTRLFFTTYHFCFHSQILMQLGWRSILQSPGPLRQSKIYDILRLNYCILFTTDWGSGVQSLPIGQSQSPSLPNKLSKHRNTVTLFGKGLGHVTEDKHKKSELVLNHNYQLRPTVTTLASWLGHKMTQPSLACPEEFSYSQ